MIAIRDAGGTRERLENAQHGPRDLRSKRDTPPRDRIPTKEPTEQVDIASIFLAHSSPLDWLIAFIAAEFLVKPFAILLHELGHAVIALSVASGSVTVVVGKPSTAIQINFERLKVSWSPIPRQFSLRPQREGFCRWKSENVGPIGQMSIALAGPLVTALLIPIFIWAMLACAGMSPWIPATWSLSAVGTVASLLLNVDPRPASRRDGSLVFAACRAWRGQEGLETARPSLGEEAGLAPPRRND